MTKTRAAVQYTRAMHALMVAIIRDFDRPAVIHLYKLFGLMLVVMLVFAVVGSRLAHGSRTH